MCVDLASAASFVGGIVKGVLGLGLVKMGL